MTANVLESLSTNRQVVPRTKSFFRPSMGPKICARNSEMYTTQGFSNTPIWKLNAVPTSEILQPKDPLMLAGRRRMKRRFCSHTKAYYGALRVLMTRNKELDELKRSECWQMMCFQYSHHSHRWSRSCGSTKSAGLEGKQTAKAADSPAL